jgi:predicted ATPase/class 3 adenylate cyclase
VTFLKNKGTRFASVFINQMASPTKDAGISQGWTQEFVTLACFSDNFVLKHFLPHFIQEHFRNDAERGVVTAFTMFVDLSGFTRLTEKLMEKGPEGAEELSATLNQIFQPTISLVYARNGFVPYFAGDSFTAIFPTLDNPIPLALSEQASTILALTQETLSRFEKSRNDKDSSLNQHKIGIKIGLSYGIVHWGIVGKRHLAYYFKGEPIEQCSIAQIYANSHEIVCDQAFIKISLPLEITYNLLESGYYTLQNLRHLPNNVAFSTIELPDPDPNIMTRFLPDAVFNPALKEEFRHVVSVFISFDGIQTHEEIAHFADIVLLQSEYFGGYFKEIDFGDKGGLMLCIFGAPVSYENNTERALEFIFAIQEQLKEPHALPIPRCRMGAAAGIAFTGVIGSHERCQYAAVGARVNLAARLTLQAEWGAVLVDEQIQRNRNFKFNFIGEQYYKGINHPVPSFQFIGRNLDSRNTFAGNFYGRQTELNDLTQFSCPLTENKFCGLAIVYGEAGIGKSRFVYEFRKKLQDQVVSNWFVCQSDQILRKPFNPFVYFAKIFFNQNAENNTKANEENFNTRFSELLHELIDCPHPDRDDVFTELNRTKSILAAVVDLFSPNSLWQQLDAKGRYENQLAALGNLFVAMAILRPTVLELEDTHWYDEMSKAFLSGFIRKAKSYPLLFLATCRYDDDGSKPVLLKQSELEDLQISHLEIDLNFLTVQDARQFAEARLNGKTHDDLFELLQKMTQGNPFYLEQMVDYFLEAQLLKESKGLLQIRNSEVHISDSVKEIMMARIDRLSGMVKETVKAAAVIGREFELPVLSAVMSRQAEFILKNGNLDHVLKEQIQSAERWQIWHAMNELRYIFRHSLLREAAYDMQLKTRLRELHQLIAEAIEQLYPHAEERTVELAFHYEQAENLKKTNEYLEKAAQYAQNNFLNKQAIQFYDKLILNLQRKKTKGKKIIKLMLRRGAIRELVGQWEESANEFLEALHLATSIDNWNLIGRANRRLGQLFMLRGNYNEALDFLNAALNAFQKASEAEGTAKTLGNLGNLYFRQGQYETAQDWFTQSIEISRSIQKEAGNVNTVANLALVFMNQGKYDDGVRWLSEQIDISEFNRDKQGLNNLYTNLGIVYLEKGSLDSALICLEKGLKLSEDLGNKLLMTICIGSIGAVWEKKGDYGKAMTHFERDLVLCNELGDKQGIAIACGLIGDLLSNSGRFDESIEYLEKAKNLSSELNYKKGVAKALNTLGDTWYYKGELQKSIQFYNQAILIARDLGNKLILGYSLIESGVVHLHAGEIKLANILQKEGKIIAETLGNNELSFGADLLHAQLLAQSGNKEDAKTFLDKMKADVKSEKDEAALLFELRKISDNPTPYHFRALTIYRALHNKTPQYLYKVRLDELEKGAPNPEYF